MCTKVPDVLPRRQPRAPPYWAGRCCTDGLARFVGVGPAAAAAAAAAVRRRATPVWQRAATAAR